MWKTIMGYDCYVEDGRVKRLKVDGRAAYTYIWSRRAGCWSMTQGLTPEQLRARIRRGSVKIA